MGKLDGVRVLDAGLLVQGPQAALTMLEWGADVIKIELPGFGDQARWLPISRDDHRSAWFMAFNRGKRSITVDFRVPEGREVFLRLVERADVVISNFKPGTMEGWDLGYAEVSARNPRIVYATGSSFGSRGPDALREGADLSAQAAGGIISTMIGTNRANRFRLISQVTHRSRSRATVYAESEPNTRVSNVTELAIMMLLPSA